MVGHSTLNAEIKGSNPATDKGEKVRKCLKVLFLASLQNIIFNSFQFPNFCGGSRLPCLRRKRDTPLTSWSRNYKTFFLKNAKYAKAFVPGKQEQLLQLCCLFG